ncbi:Metal-dependent amidase/aminoacylase/carboxypeptidase [Cupriavidus necator]|uniref:Amidohydrolase n=1 Tax=Cupriavidus necator (strain ATCC 17699 / DSM 428 / KCTC 22496 / NCIMB 10442 / H16 / Stanier 337) TaxID=381666 RepID=Q0K0D9_CUPNH|nr:MULTISPECIES: M20 aminoacylase family protein [Cupriavidus]EON20640.1 metal-dependent amidase/aminoacylase/carboxypeptidase [Cupriavidus sp. GA3-3]KUE90964.1 amidohydrolase [Cupriavidus necator]QCC04366.1 amidohydrolase [Cupriavidus necator H16]QQB79055.1 amidohydrolase [Cupriavidus necator]WKA43276.1 M20 aminoacylase family protein [Cupriavidus necator]
MHPILAALRDSAEEFVAVRRDLHRHPELGFEEHRTSDMVASLLAEWGYEVERGLGTTGVVGRLRRGTGNRSLGIRADMDALPMEEATGLPYASCHPGVMHACGHDGHTTMLLCAAKYLARRGDFSGTLNLIFQPAEEGLGGAKKMMEDGLFRKYPCDAVFAMHNVPGTASGRLLLREGAAQASADNVTITLEGVGGHAAIPHHAADPVVAGASIVMALQTIVARNVDPLQAAVITVGAFQAGTVSNIIPSHAVLRLSVRALDRDVRERIEQRVRDLVSAQAQSYGVTAQVDYQRGYPVLVNTPAETAFASQVALDLLGASHVNCQASPIAASEDFAFMLDAVPGCYLWLGNGEGGKAGGCSVHNPGYDFNDGNIAVGAAYWALLCERFLVD